MRSYKAEDNYKVTGRGLIFACHIPEEKDVPKIGEHVLINDKEYIVDVLERAMKPIAPRPIPSPTVMICVKDV